jgi:hypothetical protein
MSGLAGFPFQELNQKYMAQPANDASAYGASIMRTKAMNRWQCIGVYHLTPEQNNGRHNIFIECLDENGNRLRYPIIGWTWTLDGPVQQKRLDKPANEPAADIPIDKEATITLWVADELDSDSVGNLHARWRDEETGNTFFHHSYYVVFQRQAGAIITPPIDPLPPVEPSKPLTLEQRVAELEAWRRTMEGD